MLSDTYYGNEIFDVFSPITKEDPVKTIRRRAFLAFLHIGKIGEEYVADPRDFGNQHLWRNLAYIAMFPEHHKILKAMIFYGSYKNVDSIIQETMKQKIV
jgi:hypothetical protein